MFVSDGRYIFISWKIYLDFLAGLYLMEYISLSNDIYPSLMADLSLSHDRFISRYNPV